MTGSDDIDKIIKLLEDNDWDESRAANAFLNSGPQGAQMDGMDMEAQPDGYRAPIQYQED